MNPTKVILLTTLTLSLAVTLALTLTMHPPSSQPTHGDDNPIKPLVVVTMNSSTSMRASRFLAEKKEKKDPRAADHCNNMDGKVCGANTRCCNNKCVDLRNDAQNCGDCKKKCKYTHKCCRGQCVNIAFDKRNCGSCGNKCKRGNYCVYGMCNYA